MKLGYWNIRGLVEPIRMLLKYAEVEVEEVFYEAGEGPEFDLSSWRDVKFTLGLEFPNLPYLMDGDVKLTQTIPIMHYLSTKFGLAPKEFSVHAQCDMLDHVAYDLIVVGARLMYSPPDKYEEGKPAAVETCKTVVKQLSTFLADKSYFGGDNITGTDFLLFETLCRCEAFDSSTVDHANIQSFMRRFMELPTLKGYFSDANSTRNFPLNNKMATFGNK